jgi:uncharacterized protein YhbP (UPF0306 family)
VRKGLLDNRARLLDLESRNAAGMPVATVGLSDERMRTSLLGVLEKNVLCSMATATPENRAHINTAYFCYSEEFELFFLSHPNSLHCRNLMTNTSMAMNIFSSSQEWTGPDQGVQLLGTCSQVSGADERKAEQLYGVRFPAYAEWRRGLKDSDFARAYRFYRFIASSLKLLDEKEFGDAVFLCATIERMQFPR